MDIPQLRVGTSWTVVKVVSEADVTLTFRGYAPYLTVVEEATGSEFDWFITAKSIGETLEEFRIDNDGDFTGLNLRIRKAGDDKFAPYEIEQIEDATLPS